MVFFLRDNKYNAKNISNSKKVLHFCLMEQLSFFAESGQTKGLPSDVLEYHEGFVDTTESNLLMSHLLEDTPWKQKVVRYYEKDIITPRLSAWYGDAEEIDYAALGKSIPKNWTPALLKLKKLV